MIIVYRSGVILIVHSAQSLPNPGLDPSARRNVAIAMTGLGSKSAAAFVRTKQANRNKVPLFRFYARRSHKDLESGSADALWTNERYMGSI